MPRDNYRTPVRAGFKMIPDGWEEFHRSVVAGQFTALGSLWTGPAQGQPAFTYDPVTQLETRVLGDKLWPPDADAGPLRFQALGQDASTVTAGEQQVSVHQYRVSLPADVDVATVAGFVKVDSSSDTSADGLLLKVIDAARGSLRWQRDLIATDNLG